MTSLIADILIYLCLLAGVGFGGISLMGLLIFPDIHSRMYTALRAGLISIAAVVLAACIYGIAMSMGAAGELYFTFIIHVLFLAGIVVVAVLVINRQLLEKTKALMYRGPVAPADAAAKKES
ncbi:MAG: hypothetical protein GYA23_11110 [Methanomicrobiales archaeon]|nr:hypothetical protein [Methanomicrobiales archaeon]